jgi:hypothetical protein
MIEDIRVYQLVSMSMLYGTVITKPISFSFTQASPKRLGFDLKGRLLGRYRQKENQ